MGVCFPGKADYINILRRKSGSIGSDGREGYVGFARTSWYGTTHIQITHTKRVWGYLGIDVSKSRLTPDIQIILTKKRLQVCLFGERNKHGSKEKDG